MKINGFGKRFLSLLLAVVALVGLLSVGAMAEGTAPSVTLEVKNVQRTDNEVTAEIWANGTADGKALDTTTGIVMCSVQLDIPSGLELTKIAKNGEAMGNDEITYQTADIDDALIVLNAATTTKDADGNKIFVAWTGGLVAKLTFSIKNNAFGNQTIGFKDTDGTSVAYGVGSESYTFALEKKTGSIELPSVKLTFVSDKEDTAPEAQEMAEGANPTEPSAPTFPGYTFGGWYTDKGCADDTKFDFTKSMKEDATVHAKWTPNQTVVTFDVNGGIALLDKQKTKTVTYGGTYGELPKPSYAGYVFQGWFTAAEGGTRIGTDTQIPSDLAGTQTLYAHWGDKITLEFKDDTQTATYDGSPKAFELKTKSGTAYDPAPSVSVQYSEKGKNNFSTSAPSVAGEYDVKLTADEDDTYRALDRTITGGLVINKAEVAKPTLSQDTFTYNTTGHTVSLNASDDSGKYTLNADTATATTVGTHDAEVTLKEEYRANYKWAGESDDTATIKLRYTIEPQKITAPTADTTVYTYNGENQTYKLTLGDGMELAADSEALTQKNAGTYTIKVALEDKDNTAWSDGTTADKEYTFTIAKKPLVKPTAKTTSFTYSDAKQTLVLNGTDYSDQYTLSDNEQKNVGDYNAKVTLKDSDNYCWQGETEAYFLIPFSIAKADRSAPDIDSTKDVTNESIYKKADGEIRKVDDTMEYKLEGADTWTKITDNKLTGLAAGKYSIRYQETANYKASSANVLTIAEGRKLEVTFDTGAGSDVDKLTDLGYKDPITKPDPAPTYTGFTLVGWYKDADCKNAWDFATDRVEDDTTLYANWELSIGIEGDARFTEGKAPAEGVKIIVGKGLDQTGTPTVDLKKVTVDGKKLDAENYTAVYDKNGLTITLKQDYLNTLGDDEYEIGVVADSEQLGDGRNLSVTLTVDPEQTEAGKPAGKPGKAVKTGDSSDLLLWSILSLGAGAGLVCIGKKRREN